MINTLSVAKCPRPLSMPNGGVRYRLRRPEGIYMNVTYFCEEGYTLVGPSVRTCLSNRTWSGDPPSCGEQLPEYVYTRELYYSTAIMLYYYCHMINTLSVAKCPRPLSMPNGGVRYRLPRLEGMNVTYFCKEGYTLVGPSVRTCLSNRTWSGDPPSCGEQLPEYVYS